MKMDKERVLFLGVDAGASKTDAWVADAEGQVVGKGKAGGGNHQYGRETAGCNIETAAHQALDSAGVSVTDIAYSFFGLAGADRPKDYEVLNPMIESLGFKKWKIECDTMIALRAGSRLSYGVVLICGTGVNCAGRSKSGKELQIGGFGEKYGDFGG